VGFEPTILGDERQQTYALDGATFGTGYIGDFDYGNITAF